MTTSTGPKHVLYATELRPWSDRSLGDQICEAIKREIFLERWTVGERLPSQNDLAKMAGVSVRPVREAMALLEDAGFISRVEQKGTFLKSLSPNGQASRGRVMLVGHTHALDQDVTHAATDTFGIWNTVALGNHAAEIQLETEIVTLAGGRSAFAATGLSAGTISLVPQDELAGSCPELAAGPVVYLGVADPLCSPRINGNPARAMQLLTDYLVRQGHRGIAVFAPAEWPETQLAGVIDAHRRAMHSAGLTVNEESVRSSRQIHPLNVVSVKDYLARVRNCTGIISMSTHITRKLVETADVLGISIPAEMDVVSLQQTLLRPGSEEVRTGITYPWVEIIRTCYEILLDHHRFQGVSNLEFEPCLTGPDLTPSPDQAATAGANEGQA